MEYPPLGRTDFFIHDFNINIYLTPLKYNLSLNYGLRQNQVLRTHKTFYKGIKSFGDFKKTKDCYFTIQRGYSFVEYVLYRVVEDSTFKCI